MYESELELLQDEDARRLIIELLTVSLGTPLFLTTIVEPVLLSQFPSVFPEAPSPRGAGRFGIPTTRLGGVIGLLTTVAIGSFLYYRLYHTQLGEQFLTEYDPEGMRRQ